MNADLATLNKIAALWGAKVAPKMGKLEARHVEATLSDAKLFGFEEQALTILAEAAQVDYRPAQAIAEDAYAF